MNLITLLVIDPTGFKTAAIRAALDKLGVAHVLKPFPTVVQALTVVRPDAALACDLLIINWGLPYMRVSTAIRKLREIPSLRTVPIAVMVHDEWEKGLVPEADGFLFTPITPAGMQQTLDLIQPDGKATRL